MNDLTWFALHVRKSDAPAFRKLVLPQANPIEEPPDSYFDKDRAVYLVYNDVEYHDHLECEKAGKRGLVFAGWSGAGESHDAERFCGNDGKFYHIETLYDGELVVRYDEKKRRVSPKYLSALKRYLTAYHRVQPLLGAKRRSRR